MEECVVKKRPLNICMHLLIILLLWKNALSTSSKIISEGEVYHFSVSENRSTLEGDLTIVGLESIYIINSSSDFLKRDLNITCNCFCHTDDNVKDNQSICFSQNDESLTTYYSEGTNHNVCLNKYSLCCHVFVQNVTILENTILNLRYQKTIIKFKLNFQQVHKDLILSENIRRVLISPNVVLELSIIHSVPVLVDGLYYIVDSFGQLINSNKLTKNSEDLHRSKWYSIQADETFMNRTKDELRNNLHVFPITCNGQNIQTKWSLNNSHLFGDPMNLSKPLGSLSGYYSEYIPNIAAKINDSKVIIIRKNSTLLSAKITTVSSEEPFLFNSFISVTNETSSKLRIEFLKGSGSFDIHIFKTLNHYSRNKSITVSSQRIFEIIVEEHSPLWLCIYQSNQLCQTPKILHSNNDNPAINDLSKSEIFHEEVDPKFIKNSSLEDDLINVKINENLSLDNIVSKENYFTASDDTKFSTQQLRYEAISLKPSGSVIITDKNSVTSERASIESPLKYHNYFNEDNGKNEKFSEVNSAENIVVSTKEEEAINDLSKMNTNDYLFTEDVTESSQSPISKSYKTDEPIKKINAETMSTIETDGKSGINIKSVSNNVHHDEDYNKSNNLIIILIIAVIILFLIIIFILAYIRRRTLPCNIKDEETEMPKNPISENEDAVEMKPLLTNNLKNKDLEDAVVFQYTSDMENSLKDIQRMLQEDLINRYQDMKFPYYSWMRNMDLNYNNFHTKVSLPRNRKVRNRNQQWRKTWQGLEYREEEELLNRNHQGFHQWQLTLQREENPTENHVSFYQIFEDSIQKHPQKILLEGESSIGKTTLIFKFAYDWASSKTYISHFDAVFVIRLRDLDNNLDHYLEREYCKSNPTDFLFLIHSNQMKVLLLMDGCNEVMSEHARKTVTEILCGRSFSNASVLMTTRKGAFADSIPDLDFSIPDINRKSFNKIYNLVGIRGEDKPRFLLKHIFDNEHCHLLQTQNILNEIPNDFNKTPLLLLLGGILLKNTENSCPSDRAEFYKNVYDYISESCLSLTFLNAVENRNSTTSENIPLDFSQTLEKFEKGCLICLIDDRKVFRINEISLKELEQFRSSGFIYDYIIQSNEIAIQPIHKSLIEFMAAKFLWKIRNSGEFENALQAIKNIYLFDIEYSMFIPFLIVFFKEEFDVLFRVLTRLSFYYSFDLISFWNCIKHWKVTEELISSLEPFIPSFWEINNLHYKSGFSSSQIHSDLFVKGIDSKQIKTVQWDINYPTLFPALSKKIQILELNIMSGVLQSNVEKCNHIECVQLIININLNNKHLLHHEWHRICEAVTKIKSESISVNIYSLADETLHLLSQGFKSGRLKGANFESLLLQGNLDNILAFRAVCEIINNINIMNISFILNNSPDTSENCLNQKYVDQLIQNLSRTNALKGFSFENCTENSFTINLSILTSDGKKELNYLQFQNVGLITIDEKNVRKRYKIDELMVLNIGVNISAEARIISKCHSDYLACNVDVIQTLVNEIEHFAFSDIDKLDLLIENESFGNEFFLCIEKFTNLQNLTLRLSSNIQNSSYEKPTTNIVSAMQSLNLQELEINNIEKCPLFAFILLDKFLNNLINGTSKNIDLLTIGINGRGIPSEKFEEKLSELKILLEKTIKPLRLGCLQMLSLNIQGTPELRKDFSLILAKIFTLNNGFYIEWNVDDRRELRRNVQPKILDWFLYKHYRFDVQVLNNDD